MDENVNNVGSGIVTFLVCSALLAYCTGCAGTLILHPVTESYSEYKYKQEKAELAEKKAASKKKTIQVNED